MDTRGLHYPIGPFVLAVLLLQCCPNIATTTISPTFKGLECRCGQNCTVGVQECHLIRCVCPYNEDHYAPGWNSSGGLGPGDCCGMVPLGLQQHSAVHFIYSEKYQDYNSSGGTQTLLIFTSLDNSTLNARWVKTMVKTLPELSTIISIESTSVPPNSSEELANATTDFLDNEAEASSKVFGVALDSIHQSKGFSESLPCSDELDTCCDREFCKCYKYPQSSSRSAMNNVGNISDRNIVFNIGNDIASVHFSSNISAYHSIDVTRRSSATLGGWAPFFNDSDLWVEFRDIKANVCGLVIQGAEWSSSRRVDEFTVIADGESITSLEGESTFRSGVVLDSQTMHIFSEPLTEPRSLKINILKPNNKLNIGFRASLITCGDSTTVTSCQETELVQKTKDEANEILKQTQQSGSDKNLDPVAVVSNIHKQLREFFEENLETGEFPTGKRFQVSEGNAEIDVYFVDPNEVNKTGYTFETYSTDSNSTGSDASVNIPADGLAVDAVNSKMVILSTVIGGNLTEEKDRADDGGYNYKITSPLVTVSVFDNGTSPNFKDRIKKINVTVSYPNTTTNPRGLYFEEAKLAKSNGRNIEWSTRGCTSSCHNYSCEITCDHATSFAVLQLLGQSKLSEGARHIASILTTVFTVVSIISLVAALVIYLLLRSSIASAHYVIHSNLMVSLLIALCVFMTLLIESKSDMMCDTIKFALQYFFSAAFCWMLCEGIYLYRQIITVFEAGSKHLWVYFLIGWALPLLFVGVSIAGVKMQKTENALRVESECFFSYKDGSIWYFVGPVMVVMIINTAVLLRVIHVVIRAAKLQCEKDSSEKLYQARAGLRSAILLVPLLGCSYSLGFLASFHGAFEFTYNIINALQGFFLALLYCAMNKEIRGGVTKYIQRSRDVSTIQASTTGTAMPKSWQEQMSKKVTASRNQIAPDPIQPVRLDEVD